MKKYVLHSIWESNRAGGTYVYPNAHNFYELVYYPHGSGVATIDGVQYHFSPHTFVVIPPNVTHDETRHADCTILCLSFSCEGVSLKVGHYVDESKKVYKVLKEILKETINQAYGYQEMIATKLAELLLHVARLQNSNASSSKNFEYIINYLKENYYEKIQLTDCANQLNISYDYFQHKFKELTGKSPQKFLLEQRLNAAKELLFYGGYNCTEIAYRCGFSTSAQFSMLFKRHYGISPQQYKKHPTKH